jgi:g-D-glutamyl-meso-diaminopimelate peptidase
MDIYAFVQRFYERVNAPKTVIGVSVFGRKIYAIKMGDGFPVGIAQYAMHGREYITTKLAVEQYAYAKTKGSIWLIPLVNPDGALLSQVGIDSAPKDYRAKLLSWNGGVDFSLWKANGRGVDLNVNFSARWGTGAKNVRYPGAENYVGEAPFFRA